MVKILRDESCAMGGKEMKRRSRELSLEEKRLLKTKVTDEEAIEQFIRSCHLKNLRAATIKYYSNEIFSFKKAMEEMELNKNLVDLNQQEMEQVILFLKDKIKIVSFNTRIRAIKSLFNFLFKEKIISKNPIENISQLRDRQRIIETLEDKEIEHIAKVITAFHQNTCLTKSHSEFSLRCTRLKLFLCNAADYA